ncbi:hypothetical protein EV424DRAFT_1473981 [Suillus variegatus]|nr:hypothetical protein EV424DRAFT_1473981 [Suillus variegatus]
MIDIDQEQEEQENPVASPSRHRGALAKEEDSWLTETHPTAGRVIRMEEMHELHYCDSLEAIQTLLRNPAHAEDIVYKPSKVFTDTSCSTRIYNEMWTGHWWHAVQDRLPQGASVAPVIIATNKTQLTRFSASKSAYPVYLTLSNIPRAIYAEDSGIEVVGRDGLVCLMFPILACYMADYPEQCLVTCTKYGTCPKCRARANKLAEIQSFARCTQHWTSSVIDHANISIKTNSAFQYTVHSFWLDFPHCDIHLAITSDVLHQLYQGIFKHMVKTFPPCYGVHHFHKGWSALGQVSGKERKQMARVLLACLVGKVPRGVILAYYTLAYMQQALRDFHLHKEVIINLGIRDDLDIPKFHSLQHYLENI